MLVERIELTMSQLGLGQLTEYALMVMFGNAHSHHLVKGLDLTPEDIRDQAGLLLYPAYFLTHLKVPPQRLLNRYRAWTHVDVGVDVKRFGDTVLESTYAFGNAGELPEDPEQWPQSNLVTMHGNNLIVVDATEEGSARKISAPRPDRFAELEKLRRPPLGIARARKIRGSGFEHEGEGLLATDQPISFKLAPHRDAAPGHAMIFAMFSQLMDQAEFQLLADLFEPSLPRAILHHMAVLERETFYYGNCFAGDEVAVHIIGDMELAPPDFHGEALDIVSAAKFHFSFEITDKRNGTLLALARAVKLLAMPTSLQDLTQDVRRFHRRLYGNA